MANRPREFVCKVCNTQVFSFGDCPDDICLTCAWINKIRDPEVRERVRKHVNKDQQEF